MTKKQIRERRGCHDRFRAAMWMYEHGYLGLTGRMFWLAPDGAKAIEGEGA